MTSPPQRARDKSRGLPQRQGGGRAPRARGRDRKRSPTRAIESSDSIGVVEAARRSIGPAASRLGAAPRAHPLRWKSTPVVEGLLGSGFAGTPRARFWRAIRTCLPPTDRRDAARFADGTRDAMDGTRAPVERRATPRGATTGAARAVARARAAIEICRSRLRREVVDTACARGRGRTDESVRALKAPRDDAIRRCSLLRSTCYVDARGLCGMSGTRVRCSPTDSRRA